MTDSQQITYAPLTNDTWADFERLFGPSGACTGCWCTWWRLSRADFSKASHEDKKNFMRTLVQSGKIPGLLAYVEGIPAGWVSIAPRDEFASLNRSRVLARVDDQPVWSINCFFIERHHRRKGLMSGLIQAAVSYARSQGAKIIEAYPYDPQGKVESGSLYYGVAATFAAAGFKEVARRTPKHPILRLY